MSSTEIIPTHFEIHLVVDKSGSMQGQESRVVNGCNEFIQEQKKNLPEGVVCVVSLVFFSIDMETIYEAKALDEIQPLKLEDYHPAGCTALNDAFGSRLQKIKVSEVDPTKKRILLVMTDGEENSSRMSSQQLQALMEETKDKVEIVYMGSNQDAILNGQNYGARQSASLLYTDDSLGEAMRATSGAVGRVLSGRTRTVEYTDLERGSSAGTTIN